MPSSVLSLLQSPATWQWLADQIQIQIDSRILGACVRPDICVGKANYCALCQNYVKQSTS
jgi:hypothetical protein